LRLWTWRLVGASAAHILGQVEANGAVVRKQLGGLLGAMRRHRAAVAIGIGGGTTSEGESEYWPGLFACYDTPGLPRTNNDLEQAFGSHRYTSVGPVAARGRVRRWCCEAQQADRGLGDAEPVRSVWPT